MKICNTKSLSRLGRVSTNSFVFNRTYFDRLSITAYKNDTLISKSKILDYDKISNHLNETRNSIFSLMLFTQDILSLSEEFELNTNKVDEFKYYKRTKVNKLLNSKSYNIYMKGKIR